MLFEENIISDILDILRIFDKKETGNISKEDFCRIMNRFGHELIKWAVLKLETTLNILFQ